MATHASYASLMVAECEKHGAKPVCDHPSYCRNDGKALYIGQSQHIAYSPHRNINRWFPSGWAAVRSNWAGLCSYAGRGNANSALCNVPSNAHAWKQPSQYNPGFICGKFGTLWPTHSRTRHGQTWSPTADPTTSTWLWSIADAKAPSALVHGRRVQSRADSCTDTPDFVDTYGTCAMYASNKWCSNGAPGVGWKSSWGTLGSKAVDACCACGKTPTANPIASPPPCATPASVPITVEGVFFAAHVQFSNFGTSAIVSHKSSNISLQRCVFKDCHVRHDRTVTTLAICCSHNNMALSTHIRNH